MSSELEKKSGSVSQNTKGKISLGGINLGALTSSLNGLELPRLFYQLVIFVLDASDSMNCEGLSGKSKGEEVEAAVKPIMERLQKSKNKSSFDVAIWAYSQSVVEILPVTQVKNIDLAMDLNPCNYVENYGTFIAPALEEVKYQAESYLQAYKDKNSQALVILLSDGALHDFEDAFEITDELKANSKITIASYLLEDKEWKTTLDPEVLESFRNDLRSLSSTKSVDPEEFFKSTVDPEEVRKHMIKSISTVSKID